MKNSKKFLAVLCAVCMIMAMSAPAFAATSETKVVHVSYFDQFGNETTYDTTVVIPHTATDEEEIELVSTAARAATNIPTMRDASPPDQTDGYYFMGSKGTAEFTSIREAVGSGSSQTYDRIATGTLDATYDHIEVIVTDHSTIEKLNLRFENTDHASDFNCYEDLDFSRGEYKVSYYAGTTYGAGKLHLNEGEKINIYASGALKDGTGIAGDVTICIRARN